MYACFALICVVLVEQYFAFDMQSWYAVCETLDMEPPMTLALAKVVAHDHGSTLADQRKSVYGPALSLGIVTFGTPNIYDYASYAFAINSAYAKFNDYYVTFHDNQTLKNMEEMSDVRWTKVKLLMDALDPEHGWAKDLDYIVWVDADLVFIDFSLRLELVAGHYQKARADIVVSAEHAGSSTLINSGCIVVRNTPWARQFLRDWWGHADRSLFSDQEQFDLLYEHRKRQAGADPSGFTGHIAILPPDALNSDPPAMTQQQAHNQVLHLMGEETAFRRKAFSEGVREICRAGRDGYSGTFPEIIDVKRLAPQLTLTQSNLLDWALATYSVETAQLLAAYEAQLPAPPKGQRRPPLSTPQGLEGSRRMANVAHHFAHALLHRHRECSASEASMVGSGCSQSKGDIYRRAVTLRKKVYQLLRRNLVAWRALPPAATTAEAFSFSAIRADWPELLKVTSIAGQHLLSVVDGDVVSENEKRSVAGEILTMMQEMLRFSHADQHDAILLMVADIHQQIGVLDLARSHTQSAVDVDMEGSDVTLGAESERLVRAALHHFQLALDVTSNIAQKAGEHLLVAPLVLTANALASLGAFDSAFPHYEKAIGLNEAHLGAQHHSNAPLLADFAVSLLHAGDCAHALAVLSRAWAILTSDRFNQQASTEVFNRVEETKMKAENECGH